MTEETALTFHALPDRPDTIEIVCVTDANYLPHFAALLKSIERTKGEEAIRIHAVLDGVEPVQLDRVRRAVPGLRLEAYHVKDHPALELPPVLQISRATYLRLIVDELIDPAFDRLLYLDIDMVVTGSLKALWDADLKGHVCGAVCDPGVEPDGFGARLGLQGPGAYLNAGVLLFDMKAAREAGVFRRALRALTENPDGFPFADQDALNLVLWQNWTALDPTWNFQRKFLYDDFRYASSDAGRAVLPKVIHFTERAKPWQRGEWHPLAWLYWKHLRETPFYRTVARSERIGPWRLAKFRLKYAWKGRSAVQAA